MPEPTTSSGQVSSSMPDEDLAIRQRVRDLTSQVLEQGRVSAPGPSQTSFELLPVKGIPHLT